MPNAQERVLFLAEAEAWGGAERTFLALARWLAGRALPCRLLLYQDHVGLEQFADFPLLKTELLPGNSAREKILALRRYFAASQNSFRPLMSGYQPALHATLAGLGGFHTMLHDTESLFDDWDRPKSLARRARLALNRRILHHGFANGGRTIVASEFLARDTERLYGVRPEILRIGSSAPGQFRPRLVDGPLRMLSVSRVEANKRIDWILRALGKLESSAAPLSRKIDWQLDVAGRGAALEEMTALSHALGLKDRVRFHGFVGAAELAQLYDRAHLFLMPARQGYGIPALEALHRGIPVLLHRESGVSDILLDTPWARVFEGGDENLAPALAESMQAVAAGAPQAAPPPKLPTEDEWAEAMARLCGWV